MTLLCDPQATENVVHNIQGDMTFVEYCCSAGLLKHLQASWRDKKADLVSKWSPHKAAPEAPADGYIHTLVRNAPRRSPVVYPVEVVRWYGLSLCLAKAKEGKDDGPSGGYNNYKAPFISFWDRYTEDKDKGFRFSYNMVYSCDHLMTWLLEQNGKYGEVYVTDAIPGGHGARVRGCIFTPNVEALQKYHDERLPKLLAHLRSLYAYLESENRIQEAPKQGTTNTIAW